MFIAMGVLLIAGLAYYFAISYISNKQLDHDLSEEIGEVIEYVNNHHQLPKPIEFDEDPATFTPIGQRVVQTRFVDTPFYEPESKKIEAGRAIVSSIKLNGTNYKVVITESKESTQYLIQIIGTITAILTILLLAGLFFTNRYLLGGLWKPFYVLLHQLKGFTVTKGEIENTDPIKVDEFAELQTAIISMSQRARHDYQSLRTFTENASHEMMTPIAVITSKLDNMIQDDTLSGEQYEQLQDIYTASNKLSRLNQSLLLLVKIDNQLINDAATLNIKELVEKRLKQFQEIIKNKGLSINSSMTDKMVEASPYLIDILLNNFISNAIRHNISHGELQVRLTPTRLVIANTGLPEPLDTNSIFERFQKGKTSEGLGLGLTIARNICENYHWKLTYRYEKPFHQFIVDF
jgi:signal transduction histidine kinase